MCVTVPRSLILRICDYMAGYNFDIRGLRASWDGTVTVAVEAARNGSYEFSR